MSGQEKPTTSVSFEDLRSIGYKVVCDEIETPVGEDQEDFDIMAENIIIFEDGEKLRDDDVDGLLYQLGLNTKQYRWFVDPKCRHKTLKCGVVEDFRFTCVERLDKSWIKSGYASDYAYLASSKMGGVLEEATQYSNRSLIAK